VVASRSSRSDEQAGHTTRLPSSARHHQPSKQAWRCRPSPAGRHRGHIPFTRQGRHRKLTGGRFEAHGAPTQKMSEASIGLAVRGRPIDPCSPRTERRRRPHRTRPDSGSVAHRDHRGASGRQRARRAMSNRRSRGLRLRQLARRQRPDQIVARRPEVRIPPAGCRAASGGLATRTSGGRELTSPRSHRGAKQIVPWEPPGRAGGPRGSRFSRTATGTSGHPTRPQAGPDQADIPKRGARSVNRSCC
jgi:hypothetical protein